MKPTVATVVLSIQAEISWQPIYGAEFFQRVIDAGFNSATLKRAFVLAQIVEDLGPISVRGAFYRAVSVGIFPDTHESHYRATCNILLKLRRRGCISFNRIVDSTRRRLKPSSWSGLSDFAETVRSAYRKDLWSRQDNYIEVFVEKDAMAGVLEPITNEYDVFLNVIRGDISETFVWNIAEHWNEIEKPIYAFYFGDHDPSGLRIEQTLKRKLTGFCQRPFSLTRLAVHSVDFETPENLGFPIKGDRNSKAWKTKHRTYLQRYGDRCVEVDALSPSTVRDRLRGFVEQFINQPEWSRLQEIESQERDTIQQFVLAQKVGGGT